MSCPCKNITWSLSSFTAAEFGDVTALSQALSKSQGKSRRQPLNSALNQPGKINSGGITPLHLAAQHGHVAATWLLLEKGHPVDGSTEEDAKSSCTPLHRASFSGATATMRLLLDTEKANLLARDSSFGDQRTPLHKAAAGGRYLAVALLIDALRKEGVLEEALKRVDRDQETPLQVAQSYQINQSVERQCVARWDIVAGGTVADWDKCVALLSKAEQETTNGQVQKPNAPILPNHRFASVDCFDCEGNGECVTASWSAAFQKALQQSVSFPQLDQEKVQLAEPESKEEMDVGPSKGDGETTNSSESIDMPPRDSTSMGRSCESCGKSSFVLFPSTTGGLVCKKCKPTRRQFLMAQK